LVATHADKLAKLWAAAAWAPVKPRIGNLFGRLGSRVGRSIIRSSREILVPAESSNGSGKSNHGGIVRPRRWASELCGGSLSRVNIATESGRAEALKALQRREAIVLSGAWELLPTSRHWNIEKLREHFSGSARPCHVLKAKHDIQKYTYYFKNLADREMPTEATAAPPCNEEMDISYDNFLRLARDDPSNSYYLQTSLYAVDTNGTGKDYITSASLKSELDTAMKGKFWGEARKAMGDFPFIRSQLFVGQVGTLVIAHFDQADNIFLQVRGSKRILIFDPHSGFRGLCPYPVHHPYDQRAQVDLETPDYSRFPRLAELRGAGAEAVLKPGDALFIPAHWWHHVESTAGAPEWCISVNFWFDVVTPHLLHPPSSLYPHMEVELARQIEYLAADAFGANAVAGFVAACTKEARCTFGDSMTKPENSLQLGAQNYIMWHLAAAFGAEAVHRFLDDFFSKKPVLDDVFSRKSFFG